MKFLYGEIEFVFHAIVTGKFFLKHKRNRFSAFLSRQKILTYCFDGSTFTTIDTFRNWMKENGLRCSEGRWTFYVPPQEGLNENFPFLKRLYPDDSGLKVLKDFRPPDQAMYTHPKLRLPHSSILKRILTHSPVSLIRVANYLYQQKIGVRVYDLVELKGRDICLTCYVVQHVEGPGVQTKEYDYFITKIKSLMETREITTVSRTIDKKKDFNPPNCSNNLIASSKDGKALYVDFQGFLLRDENRILNKIIGDIGNNIHFEAVRYDGGGKKYLYEPAPGLAIGKGDMENRWRFFIEMMEKFQCSFEDRVVYDIGCNTGLRLYNALCEGARWGIGWDLPDVVESAERVLLALGATRFDLFGDVIALNTDFLTRIPNRYRTQRNGILFFLAPGNHIGFPDGIEELPWEYMFYEGHAKQGYEMCLKNLRGVTWLKEAEVLSHRCLADGDTPEKVILLLKRQT